jgi:hypothetical protein
MSEEVGENVSDTGEMTSGEVGNMGELFDVGDFTPHDDVVTSDADDHLSDESEPISMASNVLAILSILSNTRRLLFPMESMISD